MAQTAGEETKTTKVKTPPPSKVGDVDKAGYKLEGICDGRYMLMTPSGKFGVYTAPWTKEESCIMRPSKDRAVAESVLNTGKKPEAPVKPVAEKKPEKAAKPEKATAKTSAKAPKPEK